jgi:hypothetical protein
MLSLCCEMQNRRSYVVMCRCVYFGNGLVGRGIVPYDAVYRVEPRWWNHPQRNLRVSAWRKANL